MTLHATVNLNRVHITPVSDPSKDIAAGSSGSVGGGGSRNDNTSLTGDIRQYANGVTRALLGTGRLRTVSLVLRALPPDDLANLHSVTGQVCLFRDTYGRNFYGVWLATDETDIPLAGGLTDVALVITQVNYTPATGPS